MSSAIPYSSFSVMLLMLLLIARRLSPTSSSTQPTPNPTKMKQCPFCDGSGIVSGYTHDYGDESCTCPVCEGDGKINAMTIIRRIVESPPALRQYRR